MNVPIIMGYTDSFPKPTQKAVTPSPSETWFEQSFVMLGTFAIAIAAVAFSIVPAFV